MFILLSYQLNNDVASFKVVWNHDRNVIPNLFRDPLALLPHYWGILKQVQDDALISNYN